MLSQPVLSLASGRERRDAKRRVDRRRELPVSHMGKPNNVITREILILAIWFIEQKVILFRYRTNIRDELARPEPAMTLFDTLYIRTYESHGL